MNKKILVAAPQHESKNYCFDEWAERINNLTYSNYDVFLADNSPNKDNLKLIKNKGFKCKKISRNKKGLIHTINDSHNACREYFLKNDYDYMMHIETDVIPPFDVIERLLSHNRLICSGTYDIFYGKKRKLMVQLSEEYDRFISAYRTVHFAEHNELDFFNGNVNQVYHAGIGCALIKKDVFENIKFRVEQGTDYHSDTWFANDCFLYDIPIFVDTTVQCKHLNFTWLVNIDEIQKIANEK
tara:strand:- start:864 stop:1586 length:723 start_codon:yes stop_codon:yes gene_type:complete